MKKKKQLVFLIEFKVHPTDFQGTCLEDALEALQGIGSAEVIDVKIRPIYE